MGIRVSKMSVKFDEILKEFGSTLNTHDRMLRRVNRAVGKPKLTFTKDQHKETLGLEDSQGNCDTVTESHFPPTVAWDSCIFLKHHVALPAALVARHSTILAHYPALLIHRTSVGLPMTERKIADDTRRVSVIMHVHRGLFQPEVAEEKTYNS